MKFKFFISSLFFQLLLLGQLSAQETATCSVYFDSDRYELSEVGIVSLTELLELSEEATSFSFQLQGHTDLEGSLEYNERLSVQRSKAVEDWLVAQGVEAAQIVQAAYGERQPVNRQDSEAGKAANRRVEVQLTYEQVNTMEEMYAHFAKKREQGFVISLEKDNQLKAKDGTIVRIPAAAFEHRDGRALTGGLVDIKIEEAIRPSAMVFNQLNTAHGEEGLTTGGMIRITASVDGAPLRLKSGKALDVFVPTTDPVDAMNLYSGSRNGEGVMDWEELAEPVQVMEAKEVHTEQLPFPTEILSILSDIDIPNIKSPGKLSNVSMPAILKKPTPITVKMTKPYKPGKPTRQLAVKPTKLLERMKFDEVKAQEKLDKQFEKRMSIYKKRVIAYEKNMIKFKENEKLYNAELAEIDRQYAIDNGVVIKQRREAINAYLDRCYAFESALRLRNRLQKFQKDLTAETLYDKLYPKQKEVKKRHTMYFFNFSLVGLEYLAKGEELPFGEDPYYGNYRIKVDYATDHLAQVVGYEGKFQELKNAYSSYTSKNALHLRTQSNQSFKHLDEQIKYYGFKITDPDPFWCNIDTPTPPGKELLAFHNSSFVELFTFRPRRKMVNYFPMSMKKTALYETDEKVKYLAFQFVDNRVQLAQGELKARARSIIPLEFSPSSLKAVEEAILALDI